MRDKDGYHILIKVLSLQADVTITNTYALTAELPKHMKGTLTDLKGEIDGSTLIAQET